MSRQPDATPRYLKRDVAIVTAYPFTVVATFVPNTIGTSQFLFTIGDEGSGGRFWVLRYHPTNVLFVSAANGGGTQNAITTNSATLNVRNTAAGRFTSATNRESILNKDFANKGTNAVNTTPINLDNTVIGALVINTVIGSNIDFLISNVGVWNVALTDNEITAYHNGSFPHEIRRGSLLAEWRLLGNNDPEPNSIQDSQAMNLVSAPAKGNHMDLKLWTPPPPTLFVPPIPGPSGGAILKEAFEHRF